MDEKLEQEKKQVTAKKKSKLSVEASMERLEALLESASLTGAYAMEIIPGAETVFLIKSSLFPRKDIEHYGIAPLTSMYYFSPSRRAAINDYRNAVHDNDGLAIYTGAEARLWRPLCNPQTLQFSAETVPKLFAPLSFRLTRMYSIGSDSFSSGHWSPYFLWGGASLIKSKLSSSKTGLPNCAKISRTRWCTI